MDPVRDICILLCRYVSVAANLPNIPRVTVGCIENLLHSGVADKVLLLSKTDVMGRVQRRSAMVSRFDTRHGRLLRRARVAFDRLHWPLLVVHDESLAAFLPCPQAISSVPPYRRFRPVR